MKQLLIIFLLIISVSAFGYEEEGEASWYGGKFQGRTTANGEIFDTNLFTAAHKTLPFNSLVKVTNQENNLSVIVRINDRGPFLEGRIIDLSMVAAEIIGVVRSGHSPVVIEVIGTSQTNPTEKDQEGLNPEPEAEDPESTDNKNNADEITTESGSENDKQESTPEIEETDNIIEEKEEADSTEQFTWESGYLSIQVGSFSIEENAANLKGLLESRSFSVRLEKVESGFTRVIITEIHSKELDKAKSVLTDMGITDMIIRDENNS
jgi:rare lipoprotein A